MMFTLIPFFLFFWLTSVGLPKVEFVNVDNQGHLRPMFRLLEGELGLWIKGIYGYRDIILVRAELDCFGRACVLLHEFGHHVLRFFGSAAHLWWDNHGDPILSLPLLPPMGIARSIQEGKDVLRESCEFHLKQRSKVG